MKTLLLLVALSTTPALAGTLPLEGVYGNDRGCLLYAKGGENAVYTNGGTINENAVSWDDPEPILVIPSVIIGHELGCEPQSNTLGVIQCVPDDMNGEMTLTLTFDRSTDTLALGSEDPEILHRCPVQPAMPE